MQINAEMPTTPRKITREMIGYAARTGVSFPRVADLISADTAGEIDRAIDCAAGGRAARDLRFMREELSRARFLEACERIAARTDAATAEVA